MSKTLELQSTLTPTQHCLRYSMPYRIGGYYMSFSTVHKIMEALKIPNLHDCEDNMLEFPINYWLCEQNKMDVLAAYIEWDDQPGMMLVSSFKWVENGLPDSGDLKEGELDEAIAKKWLIDEADVKPEELKWITLVDDQRITLNGIRPIQVVIVKPKKTAAEIIAELEEEVRQKLLSDI
ncbi:hypothetical protein BDZ97DRAFT_1805703, partial [Flammula alnicola]